MKATRHNGRSGKNGTYNPRHNDRRFDLENSEHIDAGRVRENIYWDCYRGYTTMQNREEDSQDISFEKIECTFYQEHYGKYIEAQNERNANDSGFRTGRLPGKLQCGSECKSPINS